MLITDADEPWNAPCHARQGRRPLGQPTPGLRALRAHEPTPGLDRHGPPVVMVRSVSTG